MSAFALAAGSRGGIAPSQLAGYAIRGLAVGSGDQARDRRIGTVSGSFWEFFDAKPCAKPPSQGIGLLVGDARSWEIYFPDRKRKAA